jgi:hypothetical protein
LVLVLAWVVPLGGIAVGALAWHAGRKKLATPASVTLAALASVTTLLMLPLVVYWELLRI